LKPRRGHRNTPSTRCLASIHHPFTVHLQNWLWNMGLTPPLINELEEDIYGFKTKVCFCSI
jgi:hypothetical protein